MTDGPLICHSLAATRVLLLRPTCKKVRALSKMTPSLLSHLIGIDSQMRVEVSH